MGKIYQVYLDNREQLYACSKCNAHFLTVNDIISKSFQGRFGRAFLVFNMENVSVGKPEQRTLMTGLHIVADIDCNVCNTLVGWKYIKAFEMSQRYKEQKFVVEKIRINRIDSGNEDRDEDDDDEDDDEEQDEDSGEEDRDETDDISHFDHRNPNLNSMSFFNSDLL